MEEQTIDYEASGLAANVEYGGFWIRFLAALIDGILLSVVNGILMFILGQQSVLYNIISILIGWFYYAYMESSTEQATLGKKALGLKVTGLNGERISFANATGRYFSKIISAIILLIGFIMAAFDDQKRALHDRIAGTYVIKTN
ncbi:MAG: RDD family protein [Bacteroidetes bacterium]|nr:RDD family protein [Bacteroidota bacterium]